MINRKVIDEIKANHPETCIIAATKYVDSSVIRELFMAGINNIGENRVDSLLRKYDELADLDLIYHFIGNLQTNKVKMMINKIDFLHSLNSVKLMKEINKYREKPLKCFVEVNITKEESKHGIFVENLEDFLYESQKYDKIEIVGLMTMAIKYDQDKDIDECFKTLDDLKNKYNLLYTSMGMSNDYPLAIKNNASFIRLGRILFEGEDN